MGEEEGKSSIGSAIQAWTAATRPYQARVL